MLKELTLYELSPSRGPGNCWTNSDASSPAFPVPSAWSASSPDRSLSRTSCGTLQPHPFRSEKAVRRKPRSKPWSSGLKCVYPGRKQASDPTASTGRGGDVEPDMTTAQMAQRQRRSRVTIHGTSTNPERYVKTEITCLKVGQLPVGAFNVIEIYQ